MGTYSVRIRFDDKINTKWLIDNLDRNWVRALTQLTAQDDRNAIPAYHPTGREIDVADMEVTPTNELDSVSQHCF
jgi:hypothetical protein